MIVRAFLLLLVNVTIQGVHSSEKTPTLSSFIISTEAPNNKELEFIYRVPRVADANSHPAGIMVLFGGRNWNAAKTIKTYNFNELADRFNLYLISPSFKDDEYWQPAKWSGKALIKAIKILKKKHNLSNLKLYYYGYSAGGQCANLFYFWKPEIVQAVAWHACGVYPSRVGYPSRARYPQVKDLHTKVPMLITCGEGDDIRFQLSYSIAQQLRESGGSVIFKNYTSGHGLNKKALVLARSFFDDILSGKTTPEYVAEDFINTITKANSQQAKLIDKEFYNPFLSKKTAELWLRPSKKKEAR